MTDMDWDMYTVVLVPGPIEVIVEAVWVRVRVAMLSLLESQEVVGSDALENEWCTIFLKRFNDRGDRYFVFLY